MSERSEIGRRIAERRQELGLTLEDLAERIGSSKSYVWGLENAKPNMRPSGILVLKLARELELSFEYILLGESTTPLETQALEAFRKISPLYQDAALRMLRALRLYD